jgi:hypothetical protein
MYKKYNNKNNNEKKFKKKKTPSLFGLAHKSYVEW